ncbi:hypothetical protein Q8W71_32075 [Methylobacterium sp. NEAU 140]|uniref:hypothetical protein n=1 Tax=Methylobacterium sp. NEAU 140 TaxID=3064945 RepID=UPI0027330A69|nr:hypothetical protein [Methylobacterium sp. NEAU 140]MDP4027213.1 hypothetical protein [Methylobacterium sp. NEAU 140]
MKVIRARLMAVGIAVVFVGSARALQALGMAYALEDCLVAALVATVITAVVPAA